MKEAMNVADAGPLGRRVRLLIVLPCLITIGFGAWHFTVPSTWDWYTAINAPELVLAVRAINVLFSLLMVLLGGVTLVLAVRTPTEGFALRLMVSASVLLWGTRVVLQLLFPQGTEIGVANLMLAIFAATWLCFASALFILVRGLRRPMPVLENNLVIHAPPAAVWAVLTDTGSYSLWNPRLLRVDGAFAAGAVVILHYAKEKPWLPARFEVDVDDCDADRELRWSGPRNPSRLLLRASHFFRLAPHEDGTRLTHGEGFAGVMAPLLWPLLRATVGRNHDAVNAALRDRCESRG